MGNCNVSLSNVVERQLPHGIAFSPAANSIAVPMSLVYERILMVVLTERGVRRRVRLLFLVR
jgi:hypothetical protein